MFKFEQNWNSAEWATAQDKMIPSLGQTRKSLESEQNLRGLWAPERSFGFHFHPHGVRKGPQVTGIDIASQAWIKSLMWCLRAQAALSAKKRHPAPLFLLSSSLRCYSGLTGSRVYAHLQLTGPRGARCSTRERTAGSPQQKEMWWASSRPQGDSAALPVDWGDQEVKGKDLWLKFRQIQSSFWSTVG